MFLHFLYPLAREGWLGETERSLTLDTIDDFLATCWPKEQRVEVAGRRYRGGTSTLTQKAREIDGAHLRELLRPALPG